MTTRRSFIGGLLGLPLLGLLPKPRVPTHSPIPIRYDDEFTCTEAVVEDVGVDFAQGSDQTSIWVVDWGDYPQEVVAVPRLLDRPVRTQVLHGPYRFQAPDMRPGGTNWLKKELRR